MNTVLDDAIEALLNDAIARRLMPGAVVGYLAEGRRVVRPFGHLNYGANAPEVTRTTVYDVASITKVLPTNTLLLQLIERDKIALDDKVIDYLPEMDNPYRDMMRIRHLLSYTVQVSLDTNINFYAQSHPEKFLDLLSHAPLVHPPGHSYKYSDVPAIWMGQIVERVYGEPLDKVAQRELFDPMGLGSTTFWPVAGSQVAPTEFNRRGLVQGEVHDETAWSMRSQGVVVGSAGVFSTTDDLLCFADMLIKSGSTSAAQILSEETVASLSRVEPASRRPRGWFIEHDEPDGMGVLSGSLHMKGFTGSMVMWHPKAKRAVVVTANCLLPERPADREVIYEFWRQLGRIVLPAKLDVESKFNDVTI